MNVALDTNVLAAAFGTRGLCADLLRVVLTGHDLVLAEDTDLARLGVDLDHHVLGRLGIAPVGRFDRLLKGLEQDVLGNALLGVELQEGADEVAVHAGTSLPDQ